jgi:hypothetical protein
MADDAPFLPGLSPVAGKPVQVAFDGGRLTSDGGVLVLAEIERRLGLAERLARCIEDPRAPERVQHGLAEMIRFRALLIAAGYQDANDCDALRADPAFKMAVGRLPESGTDLCSQPTMCRLENLPRPIALKRMMAAMLELFCDSFEDVPRRLVLDIDDTEDKVHGQQQLSLFNAHYDSRCFLPIHIYEAISGKPVAVILRPGKTPAGAEVAMVLRHVVKAIRARWPRVEILVRGDSHYGRHEAMTWCEQNRVGYVFGLAGNKVLLTRVADLAEDAAVSRVQGEADKVRRHTEFRYAAKSWHALRRVIARVEASAQGSDSRFIVTNLAGAPRWLYEAVYCQRGQAEQGAQAAPGLGPDVVHQRHGEPVPAPDPHRRLLAPAHPARAGAQDLVLARRPVRHHPPGPDQGGRPGHRVEDSDQGRAAVLLSAPNELDAARRPGRQASALIHGAACPPSSPSPSSPKPDRSRHRRHDHPRPRSPRIAPPPRPS